MCRASMVLSSGGIALVEYPDRYRVELIKSGTREL